MKAIVMRLAALLLMVLGYGGVASAQMAPSAAPVRQPDFVENRGQWDGRALFRTAGNGLVYWITRDGVVMDAHRNGPSGVIEGQVVRMRFVGAGNTSAEGAGKLLSENDFYTSTDRRLWAKGAQGWEEALVKGVYSGVDVRHYQDGGRPRYDILVGPGANPDRIELQFAGADRIDVDQFGDLVVGTKVGDLKQSGLFAYQMVDGAKIPVNVRFVKRGADLIGFQLGEYDRGLPLVIDPLVYGTHFGGTPGADDVQDLVTDREGNLYLTGQTQSTSFPITTGFYTRVTINGSQDAYITKFSGDSYDIAYSVYVGGSGVDTGRGIAIDPNGNNLYLVGTTNSTTFPGTQTGISYQETKAGTTDLFLVRFLIDPAEDLIPQYVTFYGATGRVITFAGVEVGTNSGHVYVAGHVNGTGLTPTDRFNTFYGGTNDSFLVSFDTFQTGDNFVNWGRYIGGNGTDNIGGMAMGPDETVAVVGTIIFTGNQDTANTGSPRFETTAGVFENGRLLRNNDNFVTKYDASGNRVWAALLGGSNADAAFAPSGSQAPAPPLESPARVAIDLEGNVYVSSVALSFNYPRTRGVFDETFTDAPTVALTKISPNGSTILYSTSMRTSRRVYPNSLAVDARGVAYIVGTVAWDDPPLPNTPTLPGSIPTTGDALQGAWEGGDRIFPPPMGEPRSSTEAYILALNATATELLYGSYIGTVAEEFGNRARVDRASSVYIGGTALGVSGILPATGIPGVYLSNDAIKTVCDGLGGDGWFVKFRVRLPVLTAILAQPVLLPGGLGQSAIVQVNLAEAAPAEGVDVTITSANPDILSFSQSGSLGSTVVTIPSGQTFAQTTVYSRPVLIDVPVRLTATYDLISKGAVVTVRPWLFSVITSGSSVVGGNVLQGRVNLAGPAPTGGVTVQLRSSNSTVASVPSAVSIAQGQTSATFNITTRGVTSIQLVRITGSFLGANKSANIRVTPATLQSLTFNPNPVVRGENTVVTVSLNGNAGANTLLNISQTSGPALIGLPSTVTIPAQQRSVSFTVGAPWVTSTSTAVVQAQNPLNSAFVNGSLTIDADTEEPDFTVVVNPGFAYGGTQNATGTLQLSVPAPPQGLTFALSSSDTSGATVPPSVTVNAGELTASFPVTTLKVLDDVRLFIRASRPSGVIQEDDFWVLAPAIESVSIVPNVVSGGQSATGTVRLFAEAPTGGVVVNLSTSSGATSLPATVTVPAGAIGATFTITTTPVTEERQATITAVYRASSASAVMTIRPAVLSSLVLNPTEVRGGEISVGTVSLDQPAPPGGIVVSLSNSNNSLVSMPSSVFILAGQRSASFNITAQNVSRDTSVEIYAQIGGQTRLSAFLFIRR